MRPGPARWWPWAVVVLIGLAAASAHLQGIDARRALIGWSPADYIQHKLAPGNFANDWPSGILAYDASLLMRALLWLATVGAPVERTLPLFIVLQDLVLALGAYVFSAALFRDPMARLGATAALALSPLAGLNLANFGYGLGNHSPLLYYNYAAGFALAGMGLAFRERFVAAGIALGIALLCHATMGAFAALAAGAWLLASPRRWFEPRILAGLAVMAAGALAAWTLAAAGGAEAGDRLDPGFWTLSGRAFSYHWFPVQMRYFGERAGYLLVPILGLLMAYAAARRGAPEATAEGVTARRADAGLVMCLAVTAIGLVFVEVLEHPAVIQLAPHRATYVATAFATALLAGRLWLIARDGWWIALPPAAWALAAMLLGAPGLALIPLLAALLLEQLRHGRTWRVAALALVVAVAVQWEGGFREDINLLTGLRPGEPWTTLAVAAAFALAARLGGRLRWAVPAALVAVAVLVSALRADEWWRSGGARGAAMADMQAWLRDNTPPDTTLLADPAYTGGWRDISGRSYFGNLQEWVLTSFMYLPSRVRAEEGRRRLAAFGIDLSGLDRATLDRTPENLYLKVVQARLSAAFTALGTADFLRLGEEWRLDVLILDKAQWPEERRPALPLLHENDRFLAYRLRPPARRP